MPAAQNEFDIQDTGGFVSREDLAGAVAHHASALGEDVCLAGRSIPLGADRMIDLLGVDHAGRPLVVVATIQRSESSLPELLDVAAWLESAGVLLGRLLPGCSDDAGGRARLLFVCPDFTPRLLRLLDLLRRQRIELVRCRRVRVGTGTMLLVENLTTGESAAIPPQGTLAAEPDRSVVPGDARLTRQEYEELSRPLGLLGSQGT
jgi:hypothetical protein